MASEMSFTGDELNARLVTRPGEVLEAVPGLIVIQPRKPDQPAPFADVSNGPEGDIARLASLKRGRLSWRPPTLRHVQ
jgi:hypothetical protein